MDRGAEKIGGRGNEEEGARRQEEAGGRGGESNQYLTSAKSCKDSNCLTSGLCCREAMPWTSFENKEPSTDLFLRSTYVAYVTSSE